MTPVDYKKPHPPAQLEAKTILYALEQALAAAGIASATTDARCLLGMALGRDGAILQHEDIAPMDQACDDRLAAMVARRLKGSQSAEFVVGGNFGPYVLPYRQQRLIRAPIQKH